jgi:recombinational DNA repair ATPase RecF
MSDKITIHIEGQHRSISDFQWPDVPPLAVLTGVNGTGKTQLLEVIAASYNALLPRDPYAGSTPGNRG